MTKYINKADVVAEIEKRRMEWLYGSSIEAKYKKEECDDILSLLNTIEVKEVDMSVLYNGNMPIERWKEACEAASCQANYRKSKGLTETCDDYFVDGVQWADEHPINAKEVDLDEEIERFVKSDEFQKASGTIKVTNLLARHFFELGLNAKGE